MKRIIASTMLLASSAVLAQTNDVNARLKEIDAKLADLSEKNKDGVRVGAMADIYYQWAFNRPERQGGNGSDLAYRNYTNRHNDFTVNLLELNFFKSFDQIEVYADLDFGDFADQNESESGDGVTHHLGQAFLRYRPKNTNMAFTAGKFYTHFGYEVAKNIENRTYSRPFYFTLICPFWHEGIAFTQSGIAEKFGYGLFVYDKSDDRAENDQEKTYGAQLNFTSDKFSAVYNFISGTESDQSVVTTGDANDGLLKAGDKRTQHELILTHNTTEWLTLVLDTVIGEHKNFDLASQTDSRWLAVVGYADFQTAENNRLNFRYENFKDQSDNNGSNLFGAPSAPTVDSYTVTNRYAIGNGSEVRLEYRYDVATQEIFPSRNDKLKKTQGTLALGWLYSI